MTRQRRFALSTGQKIVLWLLGILIAWQFLRLPEVIDAFLTFCLAGVVPGTNIVLSPDTVIRTAVISVAAIGLILLLRPLVREAWHILRPQHAEGEQALPLQPQIPEVTENLQAIQPPSDYGVQDTQAQSLAPAEAFRAQTYVMASSELAIAEQQAVAFAEPNALQRLGSVSRAQVERVMPRVFTALVKFFVMAEPKVVYAKQWLLAQYARAKVYAIIAARWLAQQARAFWKWLVPYLWQFDTWIEVQVRAIHGKASAKVQQHDTASTVVDLGKHAKKTVIELDIPTKAKHVKHKAKQAHGTAKKAAHKARKRIKK